MWFERCTSWVSKLLLTIETDNVISGKKDMEKCWWYCNRQLGCEGVKMKLIIYKLLKSCILLKELTELFSCNLLRLDLMVKRFIRRQLSQLL